MAKKYLLELRTKRLKLHQKNISREPAFKDTFSFFDQVSIKAFY